MRNGTAVLLIAAGMLLNACNPLEISKPIETIAAVVTETVTTVAEAASTDTISFETEAVAADANATKRLPGGKKIDALKPTEGKRRPGVKETEPATEEEVYDPGLGIVANPLSDPPEGLTFYWSTPVWFDDQEWVVEIYTSAKVSADGYYGWDDQNRFYIRVRNEAPDQFILFDEWIQIGYPEIDVYDDGKRLHIILSDFRTASATITDYSFLPEEYYFEETRLLEETGINYIGQIDVK